MQAIYCFKCRYFKVGIYYELQIGIWDLKSKGLCHVFWHIQRWLFENFNI